MPAPGHLISRGPECKSEQKSPDVETRQVKKPQRQAISTSAIRESAPKIGSDGSCSENDSDHPEEKAPDLMRANAKAMARDVDLAPVDSTGPPSSNMRVRLRHCNAELARLRKEYDAEVVTCADLREQLEEKDAQINEVTEPLREELVKMKAKLEAAALAESRTMMHIEDELARSDRLIGARGREIQFLERRLHLLQQSYQQILRDDQDLPDTEAEEALRSTDKEVSVLQQDVQRREKEISALSLDLKNLLDYMICVNIEAAGGPADDLGPEELLPIDVREHLNLSEHGKSHLSLLLKKYELHMLEGDGKESFSQGKDDAMQSLPRPSPKSRSRVSDGNQLVRGEGLFSQSLMPELPEFRSGNQKLGSEVIEHAPIVAAGLGEEEMEADWEWQDDVPEDGVEESIRQAAPAPSIEGNADDTPNAVSFNEERQLLREGLAEEAQQVATALGMGTDDVAQQRPLFKFLRAVASNDHVLVHELLPKFVNAGADEDDQSLFGWTAWHIAAWSGHTTVLECLKEDVYQRGAHHLDALSRPTAMGMPPLGVACLRGQVDAVRSLLLGMAPVDARDVRGNTPLLWALAGEQTERLVPLLLATRADPTLRNNSGYALDVSEFATAGFSDSPFENMRGEPARSDNSTVIADDADIGDLSEPIMEPYHHLFAIGAQPAEEGGLLSKTINLLKAPSRDAAGFSKSERAKSLARLTAGELECGVYAEFVANYTHAGLQSSVEIGQPSADPASPDRNRQTLVLTSERLLLFNAASWNLVQVIALSEILQIIISSYSDTMLILRMHRMPDVLLDIAPRARFLKELQLATQRIVAQWGGTADFSGVVQVQNEAEPLIALMDEWRKRIGTVAFLEQDVFLLLPFVHNSVLMSDGEVFFFGFLDLHHSLAAKRRGGGSAWNWKWQTYLFILKSGPGQVRKLEWCRHPNDTKSIGSVQVDKIREALPLDMPDQEGACLIIDFEGSSGLEAMTLRARTPNNREDWITSIRTMQTWL